MRDRTRKASGPIAAVLMAAAIVFAPGSAEPAAAHDAKAPPSFPATPPIPGDLSFLGGRVGGDFDLVDENGRRRRLQDFGGRYVLLFFGYANCQEICSAAIPLMGQTVQSLAPGHPPVDLVMITVDPKRDTPEGLRKSLAKYDPRPIGLTGSQAALERAWKAFDIQQSEVARDLNDQPIFAHGSFIYLLGPDGKVRSILPPILTPEQMARILESRF